MRSPSLEYCHIDSHMYHRNIVDMCVIDLSFSKQIETTSHNLF